MPFVALPTARHGFSANGIEGGLILPLSLRLCDTVDRDAMTEVDALRHGDHYHASVIDSVTVGLALTERLGFHTEVYTEHDCDWSALAMLGRSTRWGRTRKLMDP